MFPFMSEYLMKMGKVKAYFTELAEKRVQELQEDLNEHCFTLGYRRGGYNRADDLDPDNEEFKRRINEIPHELLGYDTQEDLINELINNRDELWAEEYHDQMVESYWG
jgi:hypothetical protein